MSFLCRMSSAIPGKSLQPPVGVVLLVCLLWAYLYKLHLSGFCFFFFLDSMFLAFGAARHVFSTAVCAGGSLPLDSVYGNQSGLWPC